MPDITLELNDDLDAAPNFPRMLRRRLDCDYKKKNATVRRRQDK